MKRYAAIDVGSNAVRLLIADIIQNGEDVTFKKNILLRVPVRLGEDAFLYQKLSAKKIVDFVKTMQAFRTMMDVFKVEHYMACATSAMRESNNGLDVVNLIKKEANINLEIISGQQEANIIYAGHIDDKLHKTGNYLYIDVGGGSTELSLFNEGNLLASRSFDLGTIRILDKKDRKETWNDLKKWIKQYTENMQTCYGIGSGGNINKLFMLSKQKEGKPLSIRKLKDLQKHISAYSYQDRINILGLKEDRADVIIPATEIYLTVMQFAKIRQIYVPRIGMVDGIIHFLIKEKHL